MWRSWRDEDRSFVADHFEVGSDKVHLLQGGWLVVEFQPDVFELYRYGYDSEEGWMFVTFGIYFSYSEALSARASKI